MQLPKSKNILFNKDTGESFNGDGYYYTVINYENNAEIENSLSWTNDNNNRDVYKVFSDVSDNLNIKKDNLPNWDKPFKYYLKKKKDNSIICILYYPDKTVYVAEILM